LPCFKLAELFLRNTPADVNGGQSHGYSLFFDMNRLFEEYIGHIAMREFRSDRLRVRLQGPRHHLTVDDATGKDAFAMRPEVVALVGDQAAWIIDTKWKRLSGEEVRDGVSHVDLYQMYAYAHSYDCGKVMLLYPHHAGMGPQAGLRKSFRLKRPPAHAALGEVSCISVATVDLLDLKTVAAQLRSIVSSQSTPAIEKVCV
jgi:5-methylcytosine-specific restriction enzyme subunit McrC